MTDRPMTGLERPGGHSGFRVGTLHIRVERHKGRATASTSLGGIYSRNGRNNFRILESTIMVYSAKIGKKVEFKKRDFIRGFWDRRSPGESGK